MKFALATATFAAGSTVGPYPGYTGPLKVTGEVNAYLAKSGNAYVTYTLKGLEDACKTTPEGVANACGIHIHEGKTCDDADAVGGHYYDVDSISDDPWAPVSYVARFGGYAHGSGKAAIGQGQEIAGRAIVVHDSTGARVGCSLLPTRLEVRDTNLAPYPGYSGELSVTGTVGAYLFNNDAYVWYNIAGVEADCATTPEDVANACGIHIHEGMTCDDADSVGGHYYDEDSISSDPWAPVTYKASADGTTKGKTKASIGAGQDINGRAIVVHDKTGARVACALIEGKMEVRSSSAGSRVGPYPGYTGPLKVTGEVNAYLAKTGNAYVTYTLKGLEDVCKTTPEGVANACGIHIHEGKTCDDADAVGGHYYDVDSISDDPWAPVSYVTRVGGFAYGSGKAAIGQGEDIAGRAVVVHDSTGARVGCSLLPTRLEVRDTNLAPYPEYSGKLSVTGTVGAYLFNNDAYVWYNIAGVEADCATTPEGVANACGIHIHEGMTCDDADSVGGHYYDEDSISSDPWAPVTYKASADGTTKGKTKASIGAGQDINGRAIVVHDKTGARVACALIEGKMEVRSSCDTGCRDVCNQPFTAGGPDCCAACGCPREDCPMPAFEV